MIGAEVKVAGVYWDSSSLIKRYIKEEGSEVVLKLFKEESRHFTSVISHAEILATFHRLKREGLISAKELEVLRQEFLIDWENFAKVEYGSQVQAIAAEAIETSALRGADLIHLSTCLDMKRKGLNLIFSTFDKRLKNAACDMELILS